MIHTNDYPALSLLIDDFIIYELVLFHAPCPDGFGAIWAYYKYLERVAKVLRTTLQTLSVKYSTDDQELEEASFSLLGRTITFMRESHKWEATNQILTKQISTKNVLYVDICPKRNLLEKVHTKFNSVQVLDHHITAKNDCGDLPYAFFDMTKSGAGITWDWFSTTERPLLIDLIEDRDIWKWEIPNAKELLLVVEMSRRTFPEWDKLSERLTDSYNECLVEGKAYLKYHNKVIDVLSSKYKIHELTIMNLQIPAINSNFYQSEIGNKLSNSNKIKAAAVYYTTGKDWLVSLRSTEDGPDVSKFAEFYGGGGHTHAAAFRISDLNKLKPREYSELELETLINFL